MMNIICELLGYNYILILSKTDYSFCSRGDCLYDEEISQIIKYKTTWSKELRRKQQLVTKDNSTTAQESNISNFETQIKPDGQ